MAAIDRVSCLPDRLCYCHRRLGPVSCPANGIDRARVFATGMSNGGHMSIRLAEEAPDLVAGFAAVGAADSVDSECASSQAAVPALFMNGTGDGLVPFDGGVMANGAMVFSSEETVTRWVERNGAGAVAGRCHRR